MNDMRGQPPGRVPTLTEIVEIAGTIAAGPMTMAADMAAPRFGADGESSPGAGARERRAVDFTQDQVVQRVMADLQRQLDLMLEYRLREALAPALARAADGLIREARSELASTLRDVVSRAVAQEFARHRGG